MMRNVDTSHAQKKYSRPGGFVFPRGTTAVLSTTHKAFTVVEETVLPMDTTD